MKYRVTPLLFGDTMVPDTLDVFRSLATETGRSPVPILGFLIERTADGPIGPADHVLPTHDWPVVEFGKSA